MPKRYVILRFGRMAEQDEHERTVRVCGVLKKYFSKNPDEQGPVGVKNPENENTDEKNKG